MSEEEEKQITSTTADTETEDGENYELTVEEEFRALWGDSQGMQKRFMKLAAQAEEEKDNSSAKILRAIGGDLMPLIMDVIAASGSAFEEVGAAAAEEGGSGIELTEEELVQIYVTLASNERAFSQLVEVAQDDKAKEGLQQLVQLNQSVLSMLRDNFGDELVDAANAKLKEASDGTP